MKKYLLIILVCCSSVLKAQVFSYGFGHLNYQNLLTNGLTYINTGDPVFDSSVVKNLEEYWTISSFTTVNKYLEIDKKSTVFFMTKKERTKKYMMDRANQNLMVIQPAKDFHKDKDIPMEQTLGYMYFNGFYPLAEKGEQYLFVGYMIKCLNKGLTMIKEGKYMDNSVDLNDKIIGEINEENRSYNGNSLIINREQTRSFIDEELLKSLNFKYRLLGKEEYYATLKSKDKSLYMLYFSVNTKTELSLICIEDGRWIYTKQFPEGYVNLTKKELKLLKAYF